MSGPWSASSIASPFTATSRLWYRQPAASFLKALPLGNGRLGAMVYGRVPDETIELNEDTLWSGEPADRNDYQAARHLDELRRAVLRDRDYARAEQLATSMQGPFTEAYQPLGSVTLNFTRAGQATGYQRSLDLATATGTVRYAANGASYTRTCFV